MRELLFKNLTSLEKRRKIISVEELSRAQGVLRRIQRRFIYQIKEVKQIRKDIPRPTFYIHKAHDSKEKIDKFHLKIKGNLYVIEHDRLYLLYFIHSLDIFFSELSSTDLVPPPF